VNIELKELLRTEIDILEKAENILKHSLELCRVNKASEPQNIEDLDKLESLTARFARLSDILIQKFLRLIDEIDLENSGTVRDRINRAEKKGAIDSAESMIEIRVLRNQIAHEYLPEEVLSIFRKVLEVTPVLIRECELAKKYALKLLNS
jgi:uncharacterized protein YutE (UPF0331/DUF86 family)